MQSIPIHRAASALLTMLIVVSIVIVLSKNGGNHYFYGIPIAGILSYVIIFSALKSQTDWVFTTATAILIPVGFAASLYFSSIYGWPYGPFAFSDMLGFEIAGNVPWTYPVFWLLILITSVSLTWRNTKRFKTRFAELFTRAFDASLLTIIIMAAILPGMVATGLIGLQNEIGLEGVDFQFYIASFMISMIACAFMLMMIDGKPVRASVLRSLVISITALILFWIVVAAIHTAYVAVFIGAVAIGWINWKQLYGYRH